MSGFFNSFHRNTLEPLISLFINSSEKEHLWVSLVAQTVKNLPANAGDLGSNPMGMGRDSSVSQTQLLTCDCVFERENEGLGGVSSAQ